MRCLYRPGEGVAVVADGAAVLLPAGGVELALALERRLVEGAGLARVLGDIVAGAPIGTGELPDFLLVAWQGDGVQVFVRGPLEVDVVVGADGGPDRVRLDGRGVVTWREERVAGAVRCTVGALGEGPALPLTGGVVRASALVVARTEAGLELDAEPVPSAGPVTLPVPAPVPAPVPVPVPVPEQLEQPEPGPAPVPVTQPEPEPVPASRPAPDTTLGGTTWSLLPLDDEQRDADTGPVADDDPGGGYAHLFGATQVRAIEDAAVREPDESDQGPAADALHDGRTMGPAAIAALRAARAHGRAPDASAPSAGGHGVLARICLSGHANPPERGDCWVCGRQVSGEASRVARPALGTVQLSSGDVVQLDGSYVVGRRPKVSRVSGEVPRVLTVPSPQGEVSGSHVAIRLEDWHVLAVDLDSSNGTVLFREGQDPRRLDPQVPVLLRSDDVLDLGDGALLTFVGLP